MAHYKLIFTGPVGAGKTTAISTLSDVPIVSTEARASDHVAERKPRTTVAMDYGLLRLDGNERVHLYGTPGQERFDFMWDILTEGGLGLILLLDNTRPDPFEDLRHFVEAFRDFIKETHLAVGVTRMDEAPLPGLDSYNEHLSKLGFAAPIFEVDARSRRDVAILVQSLLYMLDPGARE